MAAKKKKSPDSKLTEGKEKADNSNIIAAVFLVILILSVSAFFLYTSAAQKKIPAASENLTETRIYKGFTFIKQEDAWKTTLTITSSLNGQTRNYDVLFHYTPDEVEGIETMRDFKNSTVTPNLFLNAKRIYITTDPDYPSSVVIGGVEIAKILGKIYGKEVKGAITRNAASAGLPVATCANTTTEKRIIMLELASQTRIYSNQGCIVVQGKNEKDLLMASERLAYEMLKIL